MSFYDDASWLLIPSGIEEDIVFAQKPTSGLGDLTFTRASDATYTDSTGVVRRSPYNLATFSEMLSDTSWTKGNTTIGVNTTTAPNGTLTADSLIEDTANSQHTITKSFSAVIGYSYTQSWYVKPNGRTQVQLEFTFGSKPVFNLTGNGSATLGGVIQNVGNGWYRISWTATSTGTASLTSVLKLVNGGNVTYTGDGTSGVFIWGVQIVEGTSALDYFPTTNRQDVPRIDFRNADGTLSSCGRLLLEPQRTNSIRNSSMVGAAAGTPGTLPTFWTAPTGLTQTVVGIGVENGLPYIDIRYNGISTVSSLSIPLEANNSIAASNAQTWTYSFYFKTIAQPTPPNNFNLLTLQRASGVNVGSSTLIFTPTTTLARYTQTTTTNQPTITHIQPYFSASLTIGQTYDFTIRIAAPQMELGNFASTWVPTTTAAVTRLADVAIKQNANFLPTGYPFTLFAEMHITNTASNIPISFIWDITSSSYFSLEQTGNTWSAIARPNTTVVSASTTLTTTLGTHKVAAVFTATTIKLFLNGALIASAANNQSFNANINDLIIGQLRTVNDTGTRTPIAQSAVFNSALSDAECIQLTTL